MWRCTQWWYLGKWSRMLCSNRCSIDLQSILERGISNSNCHFCIWFLIFWLKKRWKTLGSRIWRVLWESQCWDRKWWTFCSNDCKRLEIVKIAVYIFKNHRLVFRQSSSSYCMRFRENKEWVVDDKLSDWSCCSVSCISSRGRSGAWSRAQVQRGSVCCTEVVRY